MPKPTIFPEENNQKEKEEKDENNQKEKENNNLSNKINDNKIENQSNNSNNKSKYFVKRNHSSLSLGFGLGLCARKALNRGRFHTEQSHGNRTFTGLQ